MLRKAGSNSEQTDRPTMYYPLFLNSNGKFRIPKMEYNKDKLKYEKIQPHEIDETVIYPTRDDGSPGVWYFGVKKLSQRLDDLKAEKQKDGSYWMYYKR